VTLHDQDDALEFLKFHCYLAGSRQSSKSFRLNIFREVNLRAPAYHPFHEYPIWQIKDDMVWIKDCPLPRDEVLMRFQDD
jgi:hypothetical protein